MARLWWAAAQALLVVAWPRPELAAAHDAAGLPSAGEPSGGRHRGAHDYPYDAGAAAVTGAAEELAMLSRPSSRPLRERDTERGQDTHYPYADLISEAVSYCYARLVHSPDCCIDERFAPGVRSRSVRRPGTEWHCDKKRCWDSVKGRRGDDLLWTPEGATCEAPRVLFIHGGSWQYGSPNTLGYAQVGSKLAAAAGAVVMLNDYPLNPMGNYSRIVKSSLETLHWLADHGPDGRPCAAAAPLFVAGDSAGGGTALSLVLELARLRGTLGRSGRGLAGAFFWSPWTNLKCNTPEYYFNAFAKIMDKREGAGFVGDIMFQGRPSQNLGWFTANARSYVGKNESLLTDPIASPFHADGKYLSGLPPLYFAVGGSESILGDSVSVAQRAAVEGVDVHLDIHVGMWHVFPMYSEGCGSGRELRQGVHALNMTARFIRHVSETGVPPYRVILQASPLSATASGAVGKMPYTMVNYDPFDPAEATLKGDGEKSMASWTLEAMPRGPEAGSSHAVLAGCLGTLVVQAAAYGLGTAWRSARAARVAPGHAALRPSLLEGMGGPARP